MVNSDKNPRHSKYFEGVLQLRNHTQEIKDYINSQFPEDGSIFVSKVMKVSGGVAVKVWRRDESFSGALFSGQDDKQEYLPC